MLRPNAHLVSVKLQQFFSFSSLFLFVFPSQPPAFFFTSMRLYKKGVAVLSSAESLIFLHMIIFVKKKMGGNKFNASMLYNLGLGYVIQ